LIVNEKKITAALSLNGGRWDLYFEAAGVVTVDALLLPTETGEPDWRQITPAVMRLIVDGENPAAYLKTALGAPEPAPSRAHPAHGDSNDEGFHG
jgi:hypothetical protein